MAERRHEGQRAVEDKNPDKCHGSDVFRHPRIARHVRLEPVGKIVLLGLVGFQVRVHLRQFAALGELREFKLRLGLGLGVGDELVDQLGADAKNFSERKHGSFFVKHIEQRLYLLLQN